MEKYVSLNRTSLRPLDQHGMNRFITSLSNHWAGRPKCPTVQFESFGVFSCLLSMVENEIPQQILSSYKMLGRCFVAFLSLCEIGACTKCHNLETEQVSHYGWHVIWWSIMWQVFDDVPRMYGSGVGTNTKILQDIHHEDFLKALIYHTLTFSMMTYSNKLSRCWRA